LRVRLTARAESQLRELPAPAAERVVRSLRLLGAAPQSGRRYPDDSPFHGLHYKTVVVRRRRWSYRVTYEIRADVLLVLLLAPSSFPVTHADLGDVTE
jgi:mRNA-degrading endonuclease RelE of RelBE toxin-antitoxin system